jgi:tetratricopeptide (TPR) repeat protein
MGECMLQLDRYKEAIQYFGNVVRLKPKNKAGWEALIKCLYKGEFYEEAVEQCEAAMKITEKSIFIFYYVAALFALGRSKEALLQLEKAMEKSPKLLKKLVEINPAILQNNQVVDIVARYKKGRKI